MKIDAINFIKKCYDKKILSRRFFIKMGRQQKQTVEDWACVGYVPREFKHSMKPHHNKGGHNGGNNQRKPYNKNEVKQQSKTEHSPQRSTKPLEEGQSTKKIRKGSATMTTQQITKQVQKNDAIQQQVKQTEKKNFKQIPKIDYKKQNSGYHNNKKMFKKDDKGEGESQKVEGEQQKQMSKTINHTNKGEYKKNQNYKKPETETTKPVKKQQPKPTEQEDDGWIQVPTKPKNNRKR